MFKWLGDFLKNPYNAEMRERIESRFNLEEECRFMHGFPIEKKDRDISKATHYKEVGERDCKPKLECKSPEWFISAMRSGVMFYHVHDNTKCVITHIDQRHGQTGCDITLKSIDGRSVSEYKVSSLEMHLYFKEIVSCQVSV